MSSSRNFCFICPICPEHDVIVTPEVILTEAVTARLSGGLALLVKKQWSSFVERIRYLICTTTTTTTTTTTKSADASTLTNDLNKFYARFDTQDFSDEF